MDLQKFERDITIKYAKKRSKELEKKVATLFDHVKAEWGLSPDELTQSELKIVAEAVVNHETKILHDEVQELLVEKERLERELDRKREALQKSKYLTFESIEDALGDSPSQELLAKLHYVKLQSIDLFDMLEEMVESAIITTLEKNHDIEEMIEEFIKDITFETLSEGPLSSIRIRKVISLIVATASEVSEASPNHADKILRSTLRGIRQGLVQAINKFKKQLLYMPDETRLRLTDGYDTLHEELQHADTLFTQIIENVAENSSPSIKTVLETALKDIHYDLEELMQVSKETVEVMRSHLSNVIQRGKEVLPERAQEAKRMGVQAWSAAKTALSSAIQTAKDKIDKK
jgi:transcription termination factor NusB